MGAGPGRRKEGVCDARYPSSECAYGRFDAVRKAGHQGLGDAGQESKSVLGVRSPSRPGFVVVLTRPTLHRSDDVSFAFFEAYLERIDGAIAVQVWSVCLSFVRDLLGNSAASKPYIFACLRYAPVFTSSVASG